MYELNIIEMENIAQIYFYQFKKNLYKNDLNISSIYRYFLQQKKAKSIWPNSI